jgi:four helix bundle protein
MPVPYESFQVRSFKFACSIVRLYVRLIALPGFPPYLARQILHAGTSIGANLEEAKGAQTRRDLTAKFSVSLKEARETAYWLRLLDATDLVGPTLVQPQLDEVSELIAILTVARRKLNTTSATGSKRPMGATEG